MTKAFGRMKFEEFIQKKEIQDNCNHEKERNLDDIIKIIGFIVTTPLII